MKDAKVGIIIVSVLAAVAVLGASICAAEADKININTASAEELAKLEKVGEKIAARIIEYREKNGPFATIEDIMKVKGIGEKTFELNKDRIVVE